MKKQIFEIICNFVCSFIFLLSGLTSHHSILYIASVLFLFCGIYNVIRYCKKTKR